MKKFYIETYGCQMNVAQSSQLRDLMIENSFSEVSSYSRADIIIINACSVREHAERKVFNRIIYFNLLKKKKPDLKILVAGCFAQNNKEKINSDIIIGASRMMEIPGILMKEINEKYMDVKMDEYRFFPPV
ncbi:MAG: tRNA (N6-isopentenyl adenosine(37)-C2)-methylthiotransferase MiaB, partial [Spirochaetes bacterium]|nr:tRNA (N6-isopentenyl adenosine(37)-C2)-methylthiotransferase MiaB [Spirochaetota bacterium]